MIFFEKLAGMVKLANTPVLGAGASAYGFKSLYPHQKTTVFDERIVVCFLALFIPF